MNSTTRLSAPLAFAPIQFNGDVLLQFALEHRAAVQNARAILEARSADVRGAKAARRPDFFAETRIAQIVHKARLVRSRRR